MQCYTHLDITLEDDCFFTNDMGLLLQIDLLTQNCCKSLTEAFTFVEQTFISLIVSAASIKSRYLNTDSIYCSIRRNNQALRC